MSDILASLASSKSKASPQQEPITPTQCSCHSHMKKDVYWAALWRLGVRGDDLDAYMAESPCDYDANLFNLENFGENKK